MSTSTWIYDIFVINHNFNFGSCKQALANELWSFVLLDSYLLFNWRWDWNTATVCILAIRNYCYIFVNHLSKLFTVWLRLKQIIIITCLIFLYIWYLVFKQWQKYIYPYFSVLVFLWFKVLSFYLYLKSNWMS